MSFKNKFFANIRNPTFRNISILMGGTGLSQLIPILISPVLTRLFDKEAFGLLALFSAIHMLLSSIAGGSYEQAVMLPDEDRDAANIVVGAGIIALVFVLTLCIVFLYFNDSITLLLGNKLLSFWLPFIPAAIFLSVIFNLLNYWNTRKKRYPLISKSKVFRAFGMASVNISSGIAQLGGTGLIIGYLVGRIIDVVVNGCGVIFSVAWWRQINLKSIRLQLIRYKKFPIFFLGSVLANNLSLHLRTFFINSFFSISIVGAYSLVNRIMGLPIGLISQSVSQVFFQEAVILRRDLGNVSQLFRKTTFKLLLVSIPFFGIVYFFGQDLFALIFGEGWRISGRYAEILAPLFAVRFVVSPLTVINLVFEKQNLTLLWQVGLLFMTVCCFIVTSLNVWSMEAFLTLMTVVLSLYYIIFWLMLDRVAKGLETTLLPT